MQRVFDVDGRQNLERQLTRSAHQRTQTREGRPFTIEETVDGYSANPGVETRLAFEAIDRPESAQPGFLRKILGILSVMRVMQRQRVNAALIPSRELRKCLGIRSLRALNQFLF